ncbi:MAG: cell envelope integrity protein TolA [Alphaproteobacteria bacterium]
MRRGAVFSAVLHVVVILLAYFGLPELFRSEPNLNRPVIIEMVKIDDKTLMKAKHKAKSRPKPKPRKPPPKQKTPRNVAKAPPPPPDAPPLPEAVPIPKPKPKVKAKPKPKPKAKPRRKRRMAKIKPRRKPLTPRKDFLASVLKDVTPDKPKQSKPEQPPKKVEKKPAPPLPPTLAQRMTISELDAIRSQIEQCWNIPAGARDAQDLVVDISVVMNPDGTVRQATIVQRSRMSRDSFYRAAAESALRAVLNPDCSPLRLPPQKYNQWKTFTLSFNPREAFGS